MQLETLMTKDPVTVTPELPIEDAMELMDQHQVRHLPVRTQREGLLGILSDRDLFEAAGWIDPDAARHRSERVAREFMSTPVIGVGRDASLDELLDALVEHRIGCVPVLDGKTLIGVVTEMDVLAAYADACRRGTIDVRSEPRLHTLMTANPRTVTPREDGLEAAGILAEAGCRHLPVVENGKLVGILSDRDVKRERGSGTLETSSVADMMSEGPATARPDDALSKAALTLSAERVSALPIVDTTGAVVGIVSLVDVLAPCAHALRST